MKFFVVLAFCLAVASATPFPQEINPRNGDFIEESLITNGKNAAKGQFPYQVGLYILYSSLVATWCGGSLISPEWILTAAHCIPSGVHSVTAYFGGTVRMEADVLRSIYKSNWIIHEGYDTESWENDIALLKVARVPLSSNIKTVKLPAPGMTNSYVNSFVIASGWGKIRDRARQGSTLLHYARMQVVANSECSSFYGSGTPNTLCVGTHDGTSTCNGDSGGPVVLESGDKAQIGVVSYGSRKCELGHPLVYTRVSSFLNWIKQRSGVSS